MPSRPRTPRGAVFGQSMEAMGPVNFGPGMEQDRKGIAERADLNEGLRPRDVLDWEMFRVCGQGHGTAASVRL